MTTSSINAAASATGNRQDIYQRVTDRIVADLEQGIRPWAKPWNAGHRAGGFGLPLRHNGVAYRGINILLLWGAAMEGGYAAPTWMTYRQAQELGGQVRRGEKGSLIVFADRITRTEQDEAGKDVEREIPFMKGYTVFNVEQIDGLPAQYHPKPADPLPEAERLLRADGFIAATGADIRHGGEMAFYAPTSDSVRLPPFETFRDKESYYATALHELTHWTGHRSRLARDFGGQRFGDEGYAREELVAELGSAFLCVDLGITPAIRDDHTAYIGNWLKALKGDKRAIFQAAAHAQRAADYLHERQGKSLPSEDVSAEAASVAA
jgi:antirestriction protein ArdC